MDLVAFTLEGGGCREEVIKQDYHLTSKQGHMTTHTHTHTHTHLPGVSPTLHQQCLRLRVASVTKVNEGCSLLHLVHILQRRLTSCCCASNKDSSENRPDSENTQSCFFSRKFLSEQKLLI